MEVVQGEKIEQIVLSPAFSIIIWCVKSSVCSLDQWLDDLDGDIVARDMSLWSCPSQVLMHSKPLLPPELSMVLICPQ